MPSLILKKTWKIKPSGFSVKNEKNFSLHGSFDESLISTLTSNLVNLKLTHNANPLRFILDDAGHYKGKKVDVQYICYKQPITDQETTNTILFSYLQLT